MNMLSAGRGPHWENGVGHFEQPGFPGRLAWGSKGRGCPLSILVPPQSFDIAMEPRDLAKLSEVSCTLSPSYPLHKENLFK